MTCAAAGYYSPAANGRLRGKYCAACCQGILEAIETGKLQALDIGQMIQHKPGSRADCRQAAASGIMGAHSIHQGLAGRQIAGARHAAGKNHEITGSVRSFIEFNFIKSKIRIHDNTVRTAHCRIIVNGNYIDIQTAPAEDIVGSQGLDVFETVGKKNIDAFHILKKFLQYTDFSVFLYPMEEKKLYPLRFCSLQDDYSWGTDEFKLADLGYRDSLIRDGWLAGNTISEVMDTYMDRVVGDNVYQFWGRQFPVQVKHIRVKGRMPLRVHPDASTAEQRYDLLGREKLWYVLRAGSSARLMTGFKHDTDASEVYSACLDGSIESLLNVVVPHEGQFVHIRPGVPHAAVGDVELIEVSESSPLDFCLCGWGEEVCTEEFDPALGLVDALDFIDYKAWKAPAAPHAHARDVVQKLIDIQEFTVTKIQLTDPLHIYSERFDSFILYSCLSGEASVQLEVLGQTARFPLNAGQTMLVPAECPDFLLVPTDRDTIILETTVAPREEKDLYLSQE